MALEPRGSGGGMSGPAVGLWLFEPYGFADILTDVIPWLETFCDPVETKAGGDVDFWRHGYRILIST
ncbi:DUF6368 family protein [Kitasatospora sp. NPDC059811]|uniref:DUF6368 family protein n=1 Tax=Streptomycetaceae TaxID=2062 RepID=UPI0013318934|nr:DUF6368 family protein [Streptomyces sp. MJM8645]